MKILLAVGLMLASSAIIFPVEAQTKRPPAAAQSAKKWSQEPRAVFGIPLGATLAETGLADCPPMPSQGFYETQPTTLCLFNDSFMPNTFRTIYGGPDLGFSYRASVAIYSDRIMSFLLATGQNQFDKAIAVLTSRYGEPTKIEVGEVVTGAGARLTSRTVMWVGEKTQITATEGVGKIDQSYINFSDSALTQAKALESATKARDAGSKL